MKRVLLIFVSVLLIAIFAFSVYFHAENVELREEGKVKVFSLSKWIHSFSEVEFPEFSLDYIWTHTVIPFTFSAGETIPLDNVLDFVSDRNAVLSTYMSNAFSAELQGIDYSFTDQGFVFHPVFESRRSDFGSESSSPFVYDWYCESDLSVLRDYSSDNSTILFFNRVRESVLYISSFGSSIFKLVFKVIPWDSFEIIDIPNRNTVFDLGGSFYEN